MALDGKTIFITGSARRLGRVMALAAARTGADVIIHHGHSPEEAQKTQQDIRDLGQQAEILQADLNDPQAVDTLFDKVRSLSYPDAVVNSAAIFEDLRLANTSLQDWNRHLQINLTAPFQLSKAFAKHLPAGDRGRIINILDWRALRPGPDHLPYTISKAGLTALTKSLAQELAPRITVNGIALGAILPPSDGNISDDILDQVPAQRWASPDELEDLFLYLLTAPSYITGEIIHLDGGRHLV